MDDLRIHAGQEPPPRANGEFVLYWMQGVALRTRDNPALRFAIEQANRLGIPVLAYHGLRPDYPWASDRIHSHILESAQDLRREFSALGIQYVLYLPVTAPSAGLRADRSPLVRLAERAALVVTEFFPTFIQPRQLEGLRARVETPVIAVDCATLVPMRAFDRQFSTARAFRPRLLELAAHALFRVAEPEPRVRRKIDVPFDSPDLGDIPALLAACEIDHSVRPSPVIRGGPAAARARLEGFIAQGLSRYADQRGDPNAAASSGLSPYLHFGNISIREVLLAVREAATEANWVKFQDEALVWRELAHNFVYHDPTHRTLDAVPGWARKELEDHSDDPRPALYSDRELEEARTGEELWNACQRSLVRDGELHNYLRMLWGKAVLLWTRTPADALRILEHLNHKYALDGRDPNSYGGIHWCFGKFDRPFFRRPVFGTVRYMSLKAAREKFDARAYISGLSR